TPFCPGALRRSAVCESVTSGDFSRACRADGRLAQWTPQRQVLVVWDIGNDRHEYFYMVRPSRLFRPGSLKMYLLHVLCPSSIGAEILLVSLQSQEISKE